MSTVQEDLIAESQSPARSDAELLLDIEAFERDRGRGAQSSQLEEIFDWSLQVHSLQIFHVTRPHCKVLCKVVSRHEAETNRPKRVVQANNCHKQSAQPST